MGTEYLLRGRGGLAAQHKGFNAQLLAVCYKPTVNHVQAAPRTMTATVPLPDSRVRARPRPARAGCSPACCPGLTDAPGVPCLLAPARRRRGTAGSRHAAPASLTA